VKPGRKGSVRQGRSASGRTSLTKRDSCIALGHRTPVVIGKKVPIGDPGFDAAVRAFAASLPNSGKGHVIYLPTDEERAALEWMNRPAIERLQVELDLFSAALASVPRREAEDAWELLAWVREAVDGGRAAEAALAAVPLGIEVGRLIELPKYVRAGVTLERWRRRERARADGAKPAQAGTPRGRPRKIQISDTDLAHQVRAVMTGRGLSRTQAAKTVARRVGLHHKTILKRVPPAVTP